MSAVDARLGVAHSTLYRYFGSRDVLASAAIGHAVNSIAWPEPGGGPAAGLAGRAEDEGGVVAHALD